MMLLLEVCQLKWLEITTLASYKIIVTKIVYEKDSFKYLRKPRFSVDSSSS